MKLNRETVRRLSPERLAGANGAMSLGSFLCWTRQVQCTLVCGTFDLDCETPRCEIV
jgi:hypothetical protein